MAHVCWYTPEAVHHGLKASSSSEDRHVRIVTSAAALHARFNKMYMPSWAAAYVLDPINFYAEGDGQPVLHMVGLSESQRNDVRTELVRLSGASMAQIRAELLNFDMSVWVEEMLERARFLMQREMQGGKSVYQSSPKRQRFWDLIKGEYPFLAAGAARLLSIHATTCAAERNWSVWGQVYISTRNALGIKSAEKMIFIKANATQGDEEEQAGVDVQLTL